METRVSQDSESLHVALVLISFMVLSSHSFWGHQLPGAQGSADHHISWTHAKVSLEGHTAKAARGTQE